MGHAIAQAVLDSLAAEGRAPVELTATEPYARPIRRDGGFSMEIADGELVRCPPLSTMG